MTKDRDFMAGRAAELRRAFDETFSEPPVERTGDFENLLALNAGGDTYAVRLAEIAGLFANLTTVRLPSPVPEFLGVAALRHDLVPVYSLRGVLGRGMGGDPPRWLIVARPEHPVALAFEGFEGYLRVPPSALLSSKGDAATGPAPATVRLADGGRALLSIGSLLKTIEDCVRRTSLTKEQ